MDNTTSHLVLHNKYASIVVVRILQTAAILASSNDNLERVNQALDWGRQCADGAEEGY